MINSQLSPAEQIARWADKLRDLAAAGLHYSTNIFDQERFTILQTLAMEMTAYATGQTLDDITPLRATLFNHMSPVVAGTAAVINDSGQILLMRRSDNQLWVMPGGQMEAGETPAEAVVRETYEETGIRCIPKALSGVYDSRYWDPGYAQQVYKFTFWCIPISEQADIPSHSHETLEIGWFDEHNLPPDLFQGHLQRITDAYRVRGGQLQAHFDWPNIAKNDIKS